MTKLSWGALGERFYETGVDRGVLYPEGSDGVVWNGLRTVRESPSGGEPSPYYIDGFKYLNIASSEEFEGTIEALSSPPEFAYSDGTVQVSNGLFITQQPRKAFGLAYRSKVGNSIDNDLGYKIHLIYGALSSPSQRINNTLGGDINPVVFSWDITTLPPILSGRKPTAHLVIDSRTTEATLLSDIEDVLYGSEALAPSLPSPDEMVTIFGLPQYAVQWSGTPEDSVSVLYNPRTELIYRQNLALDPKTPDGTSFGGGTGTSEDIIDSRFETGEARSLTWVTGATAVTSIVSSPLPELNVVIGDIYLVQARYALTGSLVSGSIYCELRGQIPTPIDSGTVDNGDGTFTVWRLAIWESLPSGASNFAIRAHPADGAVIVAGDFLVEKLSEEHHGTLPFFCGDTLPLGF